MTRLQKLQAQLVTLMQQANAAADALLAVCEREGRDLTAAERQEQEGFSAKIAAARSQIAIEEQRLERETELARVSGTPTAVMDAGPVAGAPAIPGGRRIEVGPPRVSLDPMRGYPSVGHFALDVYNAGNPLNNGAQQAMHRLTVAGLMSAGAGIMANMGGGSPMAAPTNYHVETGSVEGAMVPPAISQNIWQLVFTDPLLDQISVEPTNSSHVGLFADETTPWGTTGVVAKWRAEVGQMAAAKLVTQTRLVPLEELYAFVLASGEMLEDLPRLTDRLNVKAPAAIRWKFVEALMFGTGAGQPLGWAHANYGGSVAVNRAVANQVSSADLATMYARGLTFDGTDRSFFVCNRDTLPQFIGLTIGNYPVFLPSNGLVGAPNGLLFGRPLYFSDHCQTLGTKGDVQWVNPDGYYAAQRGPARQDSSIHLYFDYNLTAFRWMFRFGGMPYLKSAVAPPKGNNNRSCFVLLN